MIERMYVNVLHNEHFQVQAGFKKVFRVTLTVHIPSNDLSDLCGSWLPLDTLYFHNLTLAVSVELFIFMGG